MSDKKAIWITWEHQVRNRSMAAMTGATLCEITFRGSRLKRYLYCAYQTILTILRQKPDIIFAPNPSVVLNYLLILARIPLRYKFVTDAHFGGVIAYNGNYVFQKALDLCNRLADTVIVTNEAHADHVRSVGGKVVVCEDPLPEISGYHTGAPPIDKSVLFICSFDIDEPYVTVFEAARLLAPEGYRLMVTGNYTKVSINPLDYPHVTFLGFLPEREFYGKLFECEVVIDLTEHENCLVCGAYEAMAAEKPLVTSDRICLRRYFNRGAIFTQHETISIAEAVKAAYREKEKLRQEIRAWKAGITAVSNKRKNLITLAVGMDGG